LGEGLPSAAADLRLLAAQILGRADLAFGVDRPHPGGLGNVALAFAHRNDRIGAAGNGAP
jgi:hypothetical protein